MILVFIILRIYFPRSKNRKVPLSVRCRAKGEEPSESGLVTFGYRIRFPRKYSRALMTDAKNVETNFTFEYNA